MTKKGTPLTPIPRAVSISVGDRFAVLVGGDRGVALEAHLGGERRQHLGVVEPQALLVLGLEEALDHRVAESLALRRLDQRVRLEGVGVLALIEVVLEARRRAHRGQPRLRLGELLGRVAALAASGTRWSARPRRARRSAARRAAAGTSAR